MRLNKFLAAGSELSRRKADDAIAAGRVTVGGRTAEQGTDITPTDVVMLDGHRITLVVENTTAHSTLLLNKPRGYVVSRNGQGSPTVYELLPPEHRRLNPIGRLDKDSSGLLLFTDDGWLANELTHPSRQKLKIYEVTLDKPLQPLHRQMISDHGLLLEDGLSRLQLERPDRDNTGGGTTAAHHGANKSNTPDDTTWTVTMHEGRNRQIRRTFAALGYTVRTLHRTQFGPYALGNLKSGAVRPAARASHRQQAVAPGATGPAP